MVGWPLRRMFADLPRRIRIQPRGLLGEHAGLVSPINPRLPRTVMHLLVLQSRHEKEYLNIHSFRPLAADLEPLFRDPDVTNFTPRRPDPDAPLPRRPAAPTPRLRP